MKLVARGLAVWLSISHDTRLETEKGKGWKCLSQGHLLPVPLFPPCNQSRRSRVARVWGRMGVLGMCPFFGPNLPLYLRLLSLQKPSQVSGSAREGRAAPTAPQLPR